MSYVFLRDSEPVARKPHRCDPCGVTIQPGTQYHRQTYVYDGRVYDWISCPECWQASVYVYAWADLYDQEGIDDERYAAWAYESHDCAADESERAAATAYLIRVGGAA